MAKPSNIIGNGEEDEADALASRQELEAFDLTADFIEQDAQFSDVSRDELQSSAASSSSYQLDLNNRQQSMPSRSPSVEDSQDSESGLSAKKEERKKRFRFGRAPNAFDVRQNDGEEALYPCFACVSYATRCPNVLKAPFCIVTAEGKCRRCREKREACNVNGIHPPRKNEADRKWLQILYSERVRQASRTKCWPPNPTFSHNTFDPNEFEDSSAQVREAAQKYHANRKGPTDPWRRPAISKHAEEACKKFCKNFFKAEELKQQIIRLAEVNEDTLRRYPYFSQNGRIYPADPPLRERAPAGSLREMPQLDEATKAAKKAFERLQAAKAEGRYQSTRWYGEGRAAKESRKTYNVDRARARHPTEARSGSSRNREDDREGSMVPKRARPHPSRQGSLFDRQRRPRDEVIISSSEDEDSEQDSVHAESSRPKPRPVRRSPPAPKRRRRSESEPRDPEERDPKGKRRQRDRF